jgi:hypothetical protein
MDGYAPAYVAHNVPLLVVSGLGAQLQDKSKLPVGAIRIASEISPVESEDARVLLRHFRDSDAGNLAWNAREHSGRNKFRVKIVGRVVSAHSVIIWQSLNLNRIIFYHHEMPNFPSLPCLPAQYRSLFCTLRSLL